MHLVLINQYYPPDAAPTGRMLQKVAEVLASQGHQITVLCSGGGYADDSASSAGAAPTPAGIRVIRVGTTRFGRKTSAGKLLDYVSFYAGVCLRLLILTPSPGRIVALTTPPFLSLLARLFSKFRGADHAHWIMDLYPDVMTAHGIIRTGSLAHRMLRWLARIGFGGRRLAAAVTLGPDMAERMRPLLPEGKEALWIPLWGTAEKENSSVVDQVQAVRNYREKRGWSRDDLILLYSGNLGLGHRFDEFLKASVAVESGRTRFVFTGEGRRRVEVESFLQSFPEAALELHGYVPHKELAIHLSSGDVHLASLEPAWDGTMVPSKLQGIFWAGRPVIFVGTSTCSMGRWIIESGGGWVVGAGDLPGLIKALEAARDPMQCHERGRSAALFARQHFCPTKNASSVAAALGACRNPRDLRHPSPAISECARLLWTRKSKTPVQS